MSISEFSANMAKKTLETLKTIDEKKINEVNAKGNNFEKLKFSTVFSKLNEIKTTSPEQLKFVLMDTLEKFEEFEGFSPSEFEGEQIEKIKIDEQETKVELTKENREMIKKETNWSPETINFISSLDEYLVYENANLEEKEVDGKKSLVRNDIDWEQRDSKGRTNQERAELKLSPYNTDGNIIELHHIGQKSESPLAELTMNQHRGNGNDTILHNKLKESEITSAFTQERNRHWLERARVGGDFN